MLIVFAVIPHGDARYRRFATFVRIVMAYPDLDMFRQAQELAAGGEESFRAAAGEISASRAQVNVEDGVAPEYIICK